MAINPAALLPSSKSPAVSAILSQGASVSASDHKVAPVVVDLEQPAHAQPLHNVVKVRQCIFS